MIQTITIDIINEKAIRLLEDLELLQLIRLHRDHAESIDANLAARYKGAMSKQPLDEVDEQLNDLRNGWE
ncbi:MAG: hypothetical protein IPN33_02800 [Saprospiraceae bacterium]|nr:hypothetical protein [Saprospiraceae bacterium]